MDTIEEEQHRKHETALSRVMMLERDITTERETSQTHIKEAKQLKVLSSLFLPLLLYNGQVAMEAIKEQFSEFRSSHDNHLKTIENMQQANKQQMMEWENERNKLVC